MRYFYRYQNALLHLIYFSGISMFFALFRFAIMVALGPSIHLGGTSSSFFLERKKRCPKQELFEITQKYSLVKRKPGHCSRQFPKFMWLIISFCQDGSSERGKLAFLALNLNLDFNPIQRNTKALYQKVYFKRKDTCARICHMPPWMGSNVDILWAVLRQLLHRVIFG